MAQPSYQRLSADDNDPLAAINDTVSISSHLSNAQEFIKPQTYYGDGPFDAPSSESEGEDDDEAGSLLEKTPTTPGMAELGDRFATSSTTDGVSRPASLRFLIVLLGGVLFFSIVIGIIAATTYSEGSSGRTGSRRITMDHVFNGTFSAEIKSVDWISEAGDGVFSLFEESAIKLVDLKTNTTKVLVSEIDVKDENGNILRWSSWKVSADMNYILFKANHRKQWRWSSFGNFYVHNIEQKTTHPMIPPMSPSRTAYATWSPTGESIAFVTDNDLYILTSPLPGEIPIRVTTSGNASLFYGVPDWVYEEEIFSSDFALWWSPDSQKIAFLKFDETNVDEYDFPIYNPTLDNYAVIPYTHDVVMKYPKPGYNNPLVSVHVFDLGKHLAASSWDFSDFYKSTDFPDVKNTYELDWPQRQRANDSIILEVDWVGNASLIIKEVNRNANVGNVILFDLDEDIKSRSFGKVVRKLGWEGEEGDDGWIDNDQNIHSLPSNFMENGEAAYLDVVPTNDGYNHIALFSPPNSSTPQFLTFGEWEVTGGISGVNTEKGVIYFQAANPSSIERHIYSVPLPNKFPFVSVEPTPLTDLTKQSYYSSSFSPLAGYHLLSYGGPGIPWQKLAQVENPSFDHYFSQNELLANITLEHETPNVIHSTIMSDGYELNVKEMRPPRMDDSGRVKYPVFFRVYGGPQSQLVDLQYGRDWLDYLVCGLSYIVVVVDGRGTNAKGRRLRNPVKNNLGFYETIDQINAAKIWAAKEYVDRKRIGIWGWSYGGFMAAKVVEANAGVHSLAISVAPVTSWRLYDSIYTERYMNLPQLNPGGYINASISNVTGFHNVDFLLAHGSADDNVHYANSAHLLDMFTKEQVRRFRFRMFTDSDHSIYRRGAYRELFEYMTDFLLEKWGKGGRQRGW